MSQATARLQDLVHLAKEPSGDRRRDLLRQVTDLFLDNAQDLNDSEVGHFSEIMEKVAYDLEVKVRQELSERLADSPNAPKGLVNRLANDEIDVARPVLARSTVLDNADLIEIIKRHSQEHLQAVSGRDTVDEEVADQLVERGDDNVLKSLAGNKGAQISRNAMETMIDRAEKNEELHAPLVGCQNLPPDLLNEMFFYVSKTLREDILEKNEELDEDLLDEVLESTKETLVQEVEEPEGAWSAPEKFIRRKERYSELDQDLLVQLLRQGKIPEFIVGFARLADIDRDTARKIIFDQGSEALAIGCKAIGFDRSTYSNLMLLADTDRKRSTEDTFELLAMYDKITKESAQRAVRFWRTRKRVMNQSSQTQDSSAAE